MNMRRSLFLLGPLLWALSPSLAQTAPADAQAYLESALQIMQENFVHRDKIDWAQIRRAAIDAARGAQKPEDTYDAIRAALAQLGDRHSFLQLTPALARAEGQRRTPQGRPATAVSPTPSPYANRTVEGSVITERNRRIARIVVPSFSGSDGNAFASSLQNLIAQLAAQNPCGWVVDLRGNGGGNMWPMLAGAGPILGEGVVGGFINYSGRKTNWYYERGQVGSRRDGVADTVTLTLTQPPVVLSGRPPVAVLIDRGTGSSGEAIAVVFRGRPDTRFFGEQTYGVANSTFPFPLSDGAQLYMVVAVDVDRAGIEYDNGISPDQAVGAEAVSQEEDPGLKIAAKWLLERQSCP